MAISSSTITIENPDILFEERFERTLYEATKKEDLYPHIPRLNIVLTNLATGMFLKYIKAPLFKDDSEQNSISKINEARAKEIWDYMQSLVSPLEKDETVPESILKADLQTKIRILAKKIFIKEGCQIKQALKIMEQNKLYFDLDLCGALSWAAVYAFRSLPRQVRLSFFTPMFDTRVIYKYQEPAKERWERPNVREQNELYIGPDGVGVCGVFTNNAAYKIVEQFSKAKGMISGAYSQEHILWLLEERRVWPLFNHQKKRVEEKISTFLQNRRAFFSSSGVHDCLATICCTNDRIDKNSPLRNIEVHAASGLLGKFSQQLKIVRNRMSLHVNYGINPDNTQRQQLEEIVGSFSMSDAKTVQVAFEKPPKVEAETERKGSFSFGSSKNKKRSDSKAPSCGVLY